MSAKRRARFAVELALAAATGLLFLLTLVWRDWIEVIFGVEPDGGNGSLEWALVAVFFVASLTFSVLAGFEWRRRPLATS